MLLRSVKAVLRKTDRRGWQENLRVDATTVGGAGVDVVRAWASTTNEVQAHHFNMSSPTLKAAILVVSTTASRDASADTSGGILSDVFENEGGGKWDVVETKIVGDDVLDIQRNITGWADREDTINVIITTGGTGFAISDSTPEVSNA